MRDRNTGIGRSTETNFLLVFVLELLPHSSLLRDWLGTRQEAKTAPTLEGR